MLSARERALGRERLLYAQLLEALAAGLAPLQALAAALAELDCLCSFAERAASLDWRRPRLTDTAGIRIGSGSTGFLKIRELLFQVLRVPGVFIG